jgi:hypothetical protein
LVLIPGTIPTAQYVEILLTPDDIGICVDRLAPHLRTWDAWVIATLLAPIDVVADHHRMIVQRPVQLNRAGCTHSRYITGRRLHVPGDALSLNIVIRLITIQIRIVVCIIAEIVVEPSRGVALGKRQPLLAKSPTEYGA